MPNYVHKIFTNNRKRKFPKKKHRIQYTTNTNYGNNTLLQRTQKYTNNSARQETRLNQSPAKLRETMKTVRPTKLKITLRQYENIYINSK